MLCYLEGLTHAEAAHQLGWPVGTVESRLARARERLKERLTARGAGRRPFPWPAGDPGIRNGGPGLLDRSHRPGRNAIRRRRGATAVAASCRTRGLDGRRDDPDHGLAPGGACDRSLMAVIASRPARWPHSGALRRRPSRSSWQTARRPVSARRREEGRIAGLAPKTIKVSGRVLDPDGRPPPGHGYGWPFRAPIGPGRRACRKSEPRPGPTGDST